MVVGGVVHACSKTVSVATIRMASSMEEGIGHLKIESLRNEFFGDSRVSHLYNALADARPECDGRGMRGNA